MNGETPVNLHVILGAKHHMHHNSDHPEVSQMLITATLLDPSKNKNSDDVFSFSICAPQRAS